ncbi:hypothetical protein [Spongiactinospora sp. 9N601]|uniref:hypothetical protein n=1 Tax=Spongiactinospora sp. 9N601 TaxID=3375149 RepID=UPI0037AAFBE6
MASPSAVWARLRQLRYPREFRIRAAAWPDDVLAAFERALRAEPPPGPADVRDDTLPGPSLADVVTSIWRLERRLRRLPGETRTLTRHLEAAWDALAQAGVKIQDHLGDPFDPGLSIKVLSYQPAPDLDRDRVVETIRPSVHLNDHVIQRGEVIVGTPDPVAKEAAP